MVALKLLIICNPSIRRYVILPTAEPTGIIMGLGYHKKPLCLLGFGYDSKNKDTKVVKILGSGYDTEIIIPQAEVSLCSSSSSCRSIICYGAPPFVIHEEKTLSQMFVNGAILWVAMSERNNFNNFILSFDVIKETFRALNLGPCLKEKPSEVNILAGSLDSLAISTCYSV
ncbi:hypothetical protein K1719_040218 [Acacia pycnantha]|nr:hypothetical protein K1719_040218 [Acacia pycnantha]